MNIRRNLGLFAIAALALLVPIAGQTAPTEAATDETGDWGSNVDPTIGSVGDVLGMDLKSAALERTGDTRGSGEA